MNTTYIKLGKKIINVEVIKENFYTIWVRLQDGHIIKRKIKRDILKDYKPSPLNAIKTMHEIVWEYVLTMLRFLKRIFGRN